MGIATALLRLTESRKAVVAALAYLAGALWILGTGITVALSTAGSLFTPQTVHVWMAVGATMAALGLWLANTLIKGIAAEDSALKAWPGQLPPPIPTTESGPRTPGA